MRLEPPRSDVIFYCLQENLRPTLKCNCLRLVAISRDANAHFTIETCLQEDCWIYRDLSRQDKWRKVWRRFCGTDDVGQRRTRQYKQR